ncbi:MAG: phosphatase PAP2 family protein [Xanthobacteraceae bacterium]|nr:phosphatase PAP2 family protein [Xanthobacteraceae bacterium]
MRRTLGLWIIALAFVLAVPAASQEKNKLFYVTDPSFSLAKLLPPAPPADSDAQKHDLAAVLDAQKTRTPAQIEVALADAKINIGRFAEALGKPDLVKDELPATDAFFKKVFNDSRLLFLASKDVWKRPRPFLVSNDVTPIGERPPSSSYPSGHGVFGQLWAIILANMVPERSADIYNRSRLYGQNRVILGVHFPTDVESGQMAATAIAAIMMQNPDFQKDFEAAKVELRKALAL